MKIKYYQGINKLKNKPILVHSKKVIAGLLSLSLLSGCTTLNNQEINKPSTTEISHSTKEDNIFDTYIDNYQVIYTYAPYYQVEEALMEVGNIKLSTNHQHLITSIDKQITKEELLYTIKQNNNKLLSEDNSYYALKEQELITFTDLIISSLSKKFSLLTDESKKRLYCILDKLCIVGYQSIDGINAELTSEGIIIIDEEQISKLNDPKAKEKTYLHEVNHLYHHSCQDEELDNYEIIGISRYSYDLAINPLFWHWQYEGAAESEVMHTYNTNDSLIYESFVNYLRSLNYIILLNEENTELSLEYSTINHNVEDLYHIFNANTLEEQKEIINMMYSIDFLHLEREDLNNVYKEVTNTSLDITKTKYDMKNSICLTMTKYFYKNLSLSIQKNDIPLEDIFYLIKVFETDLNTHLNLQDSNNQIEYQSFIEEYTNIEDQFLNSLDYNYDTLIESLNYYSMITLNPKLTWLPKEKQSFIFNLQEKNSSFQIDNIRNITLQNKTNNKQ